MGGRALSSVLLDTHTWAWTLTDDSRLSRTARDAIAAADTVHVSPITFFEIAQKVRLGKWPEMEPHLAQLPSLLRAQGGTTASLTPEICLEAGTMPWPHRDPFDRFLAATARHTNQPLVSADTAFDDVATRIW